MKKYFAKYLPVDGEIKEGDKGLQLLTNTLYDITKDNIEGCKMYSENWKKVKLFLCSRDIQVGDKVNCEKDPDKRYHSEEGIFEVLPPFNAPDSLTFNDCFYIKGKFSPFYLPTKYAYKIIGEVSPQAIWVKEGDEFDKDEIKIIKDYASTPAERITIKIKNPTCKHFH